MPKRTDIHKILIIGAGPIVIGQACEFDYSGTQACKALREEGFKVVLVNSNPATIMTDPDMADRTYIEPITVEVVEQILAGGEAGRCLTDTGRADGFKCRLGAVRGRSPRASWVYFDWCQCGCDPQSRGPAPFQAVYGGNRPRKRSEWAST